jgi:hypothetical protein
MGRSCQAEIGPDDAGDLATPFQIPELDFVFVCRCAESRIAAHVDCMHATGVPSRRFGGPSANLQMEIAPSAVPHIAVFPSLDSAMAVTSS